MKAVLKTIAAISLTFAVLASGDAGAIRQDGRDQSHIQVPVAVVASPDAGPAERMSGTDGADAEFDRARQARRAFGVLMMVPNSKAPVEMLKVARNALR